ncbi:sulfurtransferase-like selenium metabolism protein YedF [Candidatus Epulonipiscium viviparus]|uniref:sulfurtransferase-like selenium metabolism protein YedF n=1 Tax=Candidatus Epulonipiscium viviparus TaxID=420336 RepID=UPI0027381597|nr:sulfurtransferase-like selenium metabolism protein YedF [Candidatus Epulopiscium viviparus]
MIKHTIDARNKSCPLPVIETKAYIDSLTADAELSLSILVDNEIACQNLKKLSTKMGLDFSYEKKSDFDYVVSIIIGKNVQNNLVEETIHAENIVVVIDSDTMGTGDADLGKILIKGFVFALTETKPIPSKIILYNRGVFLAAAVEETIADFQKLEALGTEILCCGTCLNHYTLTPKVGSVTNMYEIVETKMHATKIIKI